MNRFRKETPRPVFGQTGQTTVEWTLLLAAFGLPMIYVFAMCLSILATYFSMVSFLETLVFP